jgi:elongator complex protein 3
MMRSTYDFDPAMHEDALKGALTALVALDRFDSASLQQVLRRHPRDGKGFFSKSELIRGFRRFATELDLEMSELEFTERMRMKPIRTASGVAPVTVLTPPWPCPGKCVFCPSDVRMPKSYLADEPGAQRAAQHRFDPYRQTLSRLLTYHLTGHPTAKAELIILGGTWSFYPEPYQIWFVKRCLDAMNEFERQVETGTETLPDLAEDVETGPTTRVDGRTMNRSYNEVVNAWRRAHESTLEDADWAELEAAQERNEAAAVRCVGLAVETRPDHLDESEIVRIRRLGATKVQIGIQSLSDRVLELNRRGHDVAATRRALYLLRSAGFKIHAHWMPNLYGSSPQTDVEDFRRLFSDAALRPDELKIYPCSLLESAELMQIYERGDWRPYDYDELLHVLTACMRLTPEYCRLTRVIRDIPGTDIVAGNRRTNFRQIARERLDADGVSSRDIRSREIRHRDVDPTRLRYRAIEYETAVGCEHFLQFVTRENRLAGFLRLSLPTSLAAMPEIENSAMIREVHIYGRMVEPGRRHPGRSQHIGLGRRLIERAAGIARRARYEDLAVISAIGTRDYYRDLGFVDGALYQHRALGAG